MIHYFFPAMVTLSVSTLIGLFIGGVIRGPRGSEPDKCEQMAKIAEQTVAKEEVWIGELGRRIKDRAEQIDMLNYEQRTDQLALNLLLGRKWKDEAGQ